MVGVDVHVKSKIEFHPKADLKLERCCFLVFYFVTLSVPESIMETCSVVLTFESVNEILWCDHSNETSLAVLFHGTICFSIFSKIKIGIFLVF